MSKLAIRLSMLAIGATMLVAVPTLAPTKAEARSRHVHIQKHKRHRSFAGPLLVGPAFRPSYPNGEVCPGSGRSFECKIWPPPMAEDPDRRTSKY
jgi:hypothetical protein